MLQVSDGFFCSMSQSWKKVFVMARPNSEQREQPETATIHVANTMTTNDSMPYVVISADLPTAAMSSL